MQSLHKFLIPISLILFLASVSSSVLSSASSSASNESSIYEVLKLNGLPMGLLPKGVKNFSIDDSGKFVAHLDRDCNAKFENELHYSINVSGTIKYGQIDGLSGITAQDLFLWLQVLEIRVDISRSGLIYFDLGVVSKQFSLSSFETPRDCLASPSPDLQESRHILDTITKIKAGKLRNEADEDNDARTAL